MNLTSIGRVLVPVADQDEAIEFYTKKLGFTLTADNPFGDGSRWVEVTPPGGGAAIALVPPQGSYLPGRMTGISISSTDPKADFEAFQAAGIEIDGEMMGGDGEVPVLFFFKDNNGNHMMLVQAT